MKKALKKEYKTDKNNLGKMLIYLIKFQPS